MITERPKKSFFSKYWGWFLGGFLFLCIAAAGLLLLLLHSFIWGEAKVTGLNLSAGSVVYGEHATASITVTNTGLLPLKFSGNVLIDGAEQPTDNITLSFNDPQTMSVDLSSLKPGSHTVASGSFEEDFKVLRPAEFKVTGITVSPEEIHVGSTVTATATITNTGEVAGSLNDAFTYDGVALDTSTVKIDLGPGEEKKVTATFPVNTKGSHAIALLDQKSTLNVVSQARIILIGFTISQSFAKPGENVTATATLQNSGDADGQFTLDVTVNGKTFKKQNVTVKGNSTQAFTISIMEKNGGTYSLKCGPLARTLNVVLITRPKTGTLLVKKVNGGSGRLTIYNGYANKDVVLTLASSSNPKAALLTIYLRAGEKASNIKVKDGTYVIFYSVGSSFDSASGKFISNALFFRSPSTFKFKTTRTTYTKGEMKLNVANGTSFPEPVGEGDFPK